MSLKRVCIKDRKTGVIMRVYDYSAKIAVEENNTHHYTTKRALRSFLNQQLKLVKNAVIVNRLDFSKKSKNKVWEDSYTGKTYAAIWHKDYEQPTGKLNKMAMPEVIIKPVYTFRIVKFPN